MSKAIQLCRVRYKMFFKMNHNMLNALTSPSLSRYFLSLTYPQGPIPISRRVWVIRSPSHRNDCPSLTAFPTALITPTFDPVVISQAFVVFAAWWGKLFKHVRVANCHKVEKRVCVLPLCKAYHPWIVKLKMIEKKFGIQNNFRWLND